MLRSIISRLTELRDTPGSFVGHAARLLAVKADESGVEFVDPGAPSPHDLGGAHHGADTLANLNAKITDATLDDAGDPRDPTAHASDHEPGGTDEMAVDEPAGTGSLRTLGTGAQQAAAGDHDHDPELPPAGDAGTLLVSDGTGWQTLTVGSDDQALVADSTAPLGVRWADVTVTQTTYDTLAADYADYDALAAAYPDYDAIGA